MRYASTGSPDASWWRRFDDRRPGVRSGDAGFTLLETLLAMVILAMSLTALYQSTVTSTRAISAADLHMEARLLADTLLAEQSSLVAPKPGITNGKFRDLQWQVTMEPATAAWAQTSAESGWMAYLVTVKVQWPPNRSLILVGVRTAAKSK